MRRQTAGLIISGVVFLHLTFFSCVAWKPDEETLILYARAANVYAEGRFAESAELLSTINDFSPALTLKGKAEFFSNREDEAEKSFRRALKLNPANTEASIYLARLLREKGEYKEAENISEGLLADNPFDIRALRLAADLAKEKGPDGEAPAMAFLDRAAEASAEIALVFLDRARLRWVAGSTQGALEDLARARAVLPGESPLRRSILSLESTIKTVISANIERGVLP